MIDLPETSSHWINDTPTQPSPAGCLLVRTSKHALALREELRQRLNKISGVDLPQAKVDLRPGFELSILQQPEARESLIEALRWFNNTLGGEKQT
jgi:hypothetical protein